MEAVSGKEQLDLTRKEIAKDVFASEVWPLLSNLEDSKLRLAKALPATVLRSRADSTTNWGISAVESLGGC